MKRVYLPKPDGKEARPIGMPTIENKVLEFLGFIHYWVKGRGGR